MCVTLLNEGKGQRREVRRMGWQSPGWTALVVAELPEGATARCLVAAPAIPSRQQARCRSICMLLKLKDSGVFGEDAFSAFCFARKNASKTPQDA